jgi:hypothetical protein
MLFASPTDSLPTYSPELVRPFSTRVQGNFLHVLDGGISSAYWNAAGLIPETQGRIHTYQIDSNTGGLTYRSTWTPDFTGTNVMPLSLDFFTTSSGRTVAYTADRLNRLPDGSEALSQRLQILDYNTATGQLSLAPSNPSTFAATTSPVHLQVQGNFLYVLDEPYGVARNLDIYQIEAATGALNYQRSLDLPPNYWPYDLRFYSTPSNQLQLDVFAYTGFLPEQNVPITYRVDPLTGDLTQTGVEVAPYRTRLAGDRRVAGDFLYVEGYGVPSARFLWEVPINDANINVETAQPSQRPFDDQFRPNYRQVRVPEVFIGSSAEFDTFTTQSGEINLYYADGRNQRIIVFDETARAEDTSPIPFRDYSAGLDHTDFNADQLPDLVWRNYRTGETTVWTMTGTRQLGSISLSTQGNLDWQVVRTAPFDSTNPAYNNATNLVWHNTRTGETQISRYERDSLRPGSSLPRSNPSVTTLPSTGPGWQLIAGGSNIIGN